MTLLKTGVLEVDISIPRKFHSDKENSELRAIVFESFATSIPRIVSSLQLRSPVEFQSRIVTQVTNALYMFLHDKSKPAVGKGEKAIHSGFIQLLAAQQMTGHIYGYEPKIALPDGWQVRIDPKDPERVEFYRR